MTENWKLFHAERYPDGSVGNISGPFGIDNVLCKSLSPVAAKTAKVEFGGTQFKLLQFVLANGSKFYAVPNQLMEDFDNLLKPLSDLSADGKLADVQVATQLGTFSPSLVHFVLFPISFCFACCFDLFCSLIYCIVLSS